MRSYELTCTECRQAFPSPRHHAQTCSDRCRQTRARRTRSLQAKRDTTPPAEIVSVLYARRRSVYFSLPGTDVWTADRDARNYQASNRIVAHPPCRAWGTLRYLAKPRPDERALALHAVETVRRCGGVLEHPARSSLWPVAHLPEPGARDDHGGWTLCVDQFWFGHLAYKPTRLYIVGCSPKDCPDLPFSISPPTHSICPAHGIRSGDPRYRTALSAPAREATPPAFARWLVSLARRCHV